MRNYSRKTYQKRARFRTPSRFIARKTRDLKRKTFKK